MQLVGTVVAPTPLVAANFIILGKIIGLAGPQYSRLTPKICQCCPNTADDVVCLIVQALGGASAARAVSQETSAATVCTSFIISFNIHFIEIGRQHHARRNCCPALCVYVTLASEFFLRLKYDAPVRHVEQPRVLEKGQSAVSKNLRIMIYAMAFCTLCIFIRSIYRTVELAGGWFGPVITTQRYFDWLDGGMVTLAIYTQNFFHPGIWLNKADPTAQVSQQEVDEEEAAT
ncbi:RTA-like protein [Suillus subaureus]|uniref:RTA-like protein n=1 Tax=Suillus subaureus TaxID=48587 RepID=A0A9P7E1V7_9AGAM|nr:RTA-like protein [Suillus subaureus]KAG1809143.1 RTA-like protein [Suillus subaureus]